MRWAGPRWRRWSEPRRLNDEVTSDQTGHALNPAQIEHEVGE